MEHYKNYIGQFVKRFYTPFEKESIFKIKSYRTNKDLNDMPFMIPEFLYDDGTKEWWSDCEDSCIITNEMPILEIYFVSNVNSDEYKGFNPFTNQIKK